MKAFYAICAVIALCIFAYTAYQTALITQSAKNFFDNPQAHNLYLPPKLIQDLEKLLGSPQTPVPAPQASAPAPAQQPQAGHTGFYRYAFPDIKGGAYFVDYSGYSSINVRVWNEGNQHTCDFVAQCEKDDNDGSLFNCYSDGQKVVLKLAGKNMEIIDEDYKASRESCGLNMSFNGSYVKN